MTGESVLFFSFLPLVCRAHHNISRQPTCTFPPVSSPFWLNISYLLLQLFYKTPYFCSVRERCVLSLFFPFFYFERRREVDPGFSPFFACFWMARVYSCAGKRSKPGVGFLFWFVFFFGFFVCLVWFGGVGFFFLFFCGLGVFFFLLWWFVFFVFGFFFLWGGFWWCVFVGWVLVGCPSLPYLPKHTPPLSLSPLFVSVFSEVVETVWQASRTL